MNYRKKIAAIDKSRFIQLICTVRIGWNICSTQAALDFAEIGLVCVPIPVQFRIFTTHGNWPQVRPGHARDKRVHIAIIHIPIAVHIARNHRRTSVAVHNRTDNGIRTNIVTIRHTVGITVRLRHAATAHTRRDLIRIVRTTILAIWRAVTIGVSADDGKCLRACRTIIGLIFDRNGHRVRPKPQQGARGRILRLGQASTSGAIIISRHIAGHIRHRRLTIRIRRGAGIGTTRYDRRDRTIRHRECSRACGLVISQIFHGHRYRVRPDSDECADCGALCLDQLTAARAVVRRRHIRGKVRHRRLATGVGRRVLIRSARRNVRHDGISNRYILGRCAR